MRLEAGQAEEGQAIQSPFFRLQSRGTQKAICAVAASLLTAITTSFRNGTNTTYLGADHFIAFERRPQPSAGAQLTRLGFEVHFKRTPQAE